MLSIIKYQKLQSPLTGSFARNGVILLAAFFLMGVSLHLQGQENKQKTKKPQSKVEQDMERWEKPKAKAPARPQQQAKKAPPAPKIVPAPPAKPKPKPTPKPPLQARKKASKAKPAVTPAKPKPEITAAKEAEEDMTGIPEVTAYGKTQHQKLQTVTFNSTQPDIELLVDGERIGAIDGKLTLTAKLKPGPHTITLARNGFEQQDLPIEVKTTGKNTVLLPALKPITVPRIVGTEGAPTPTPTMVAPTPTPAIMVAAAASPTPAPVVQPVFGSNPVEVLRNVDNLLQRFKDPARTNQVTAQDWADVRNQIAAVIRRDPNNIELLARDYLAQGQLLFLDKKYFEAREKFREGVKAMPNFSVLQYMLGNTFLVSDEPNEALGYFRAAVTQEQSFALAHKALADAFSRLGDSKNANSEYLRARSLGFISPEISAALGRNLMREPTWLQAISELKAAADSQPTAEIYLDLATCYDALKRPLSTVEAYQEAIRANAENAEAHFRLAETYFSLNEFKRAADEYERYLILAPKDPKPKRDLARQRANEARRRAETGK